MTMQTEARTSERPAITRAMERNLTLRKRPVLVGTYDVKTRDPLPVGDGTIRRARAVAEALFSSEAGAPPAERLDWLGKELRGFAGHSGEDARRILSLTLFAVTVLGPLLSFQFGFVDKSLAERRELLEKIERGPLAPAILAVKAALCILYFEHPDAQKEIGGPFGCLVEHDSKSTKPSHEEAAQ